MSRYTGPRARISRRLGTNIFGTRGETNALEKRPYPPGIHGRTRRRGNNNSEYLIQRAKRMKAQGSGGTMVLVSSIAHHGANAVLWPYAASKHALEALVKNAAFSLMTERIRVNMINPGWMDTPAEHDVQVRFHDAPENWLEAAEASQPTGRLLKPQEVARGICFLASDESGMMSGASVDFDQTIPGVGDLPRSEPVPEHFPWEDA